MTTTGRSRSGRFWEQAPVAAENYERDLVPALFEPWARELAALAELRPGERVLDLACGTGIAARIAAPSLGRHGTITALDVNGDMLAVARRVCANVRPPIRWRRASAHDTGLPDASFDVVLCQQGLQFFPDRRAAACEMYRLTAPGGRVATSVWTKPDNPGYTPILAALERHLPGAPGAAGFVRAIFSLADAAELRDLLTEAGYRTVDVSRRTRLVRFPSAAAWVRAFLGAAPIPDVAALAPPVREQIINEVVAALPGYDGGDGFAFPIDANIAVAR